MEPKDKKALTSEMFTGDEESRDKIIDELTPEENKLALEILEEKIDEPDKDTSLKSKEPEPPIKDEDTSGDKKDEDIKSDDDKTKEDDEDKFLLTEELIEKQPEENREILSKYKDKSKEDLAQAAANAVALKSPYLKENEKAIALMTEQFLEKSGDELINILVDTQKGAGKTEKEEAKKVVEKIELPELPDDDPEIQKVLDKEILTRLKVKYPNMPAVENLENEDYKEFRRDLNIDDPDNKFKEDLQQTKEAVKTELSKIVYIQKNLPNLYEESPNEVLPLFTEQNLPRLKALNDNPMSVLEQDIQVEIESIRNGLKKYGLTEKDLDIDLTITKDETGTPFNKTLNDLIVEGRTADGAPIPSSKIIGVRGKTFWLKQGELARKFKEEFDDKILTAFVEKKTQKEKTHKEKLKDENLKQGFSTGKGGKKVLTVEDIEKLSPEENKQLLAEMEKVS